MGEQTNLHIVPILSECDRRRQAADACADYGDVKSRIREFVGVSPLAFNPEHWTSSERAGLEVVNILCGFRGQHGRREAQGGNTVPHTWSFQSDYGVRAQQFPDWFRVHDFIPINRTKWSRVRVVSESKTGRMNILMLITDEYMEVAKYSRGQVVESKRGVDCRLTGVLFLPRLPYAQTDGTQITQTPDGLPVSPPFSLPLAITGLRENNELWVRKKTHINIVCPYGTRRLAPRPLSFHTFDSHRPRIESTTAGHSISKCGGYQHTLKKGKCPGA
ncbi:hypothetical protein B0H14DRAFT_2636114 [Mycena olivaceomarginata]|nr:hypothetical protein B0H14DRAFT_2636114 [Mycena olivaceomarginata]